MMELREIDYVLMMERYGSISEAAKNLFITQSSLSQFLKKYETQLGCQLFIRDKKNMLITPKGILLRDRAREIVNMVNETILLLQTTDETERCVIHMGTISSICNRVLPDKVLQMKDRYPHVEFVLHEGSTTQILEMLADGTVDFGIVREPFNVSAYNSRPVRDTALGEDSQDYFTAVGKESFFDEPELRIVPLTSLRNKPIIIHRRYCDMFTAACRQQGFVPNIICQNDNIASSLSWASSGIGIAIAPYTSAIQNTDPSLMLKRIDSPAIVSKAHLIWNKSALLTPEEKYFAGLFG